ncbi:hypothetical protein PSP6_50323 [Paraburkholderia tropica]|nr:hypothetical protein PSP6_50323 [Paraburkholderia tropica]
MRLTGFLAREKIDSHSMNQSLL